MWNTTVSSRSHRKYKGAIAIVTRESMEAGAEKAVGGMWNCMSYGGKGNHSCAQLGVGGITSFAFQKDDYSVSVEDELERGNPRGMYENGVCFFF